MEDKKKKILLIYPPSPVLNREDRCQQPTKELLVIPPLPPTDLMYLAAVAENVGFEAKIVDYSQGGDFEKDLKEFQPDYLVVNVATPTFKSDLASLTVAKEICPDVITIAKGAAFLTVALDVMYFQKDLDLIIYGEPEETLKEILEGRKYPRILGLYYRDDLRAKFTGPRPFIEDLDKLPFPARHLVDNNIYRRPDNNKVQAVIKVSRGCPFHCFFCLATPVSGAKVRKRSAENIIEEIRECVEKYGITNFLFWSDIFNIDREWVMDLCQKIIDSGLKITWSANTRADTADEEMAYKMYEAGCRLVSIGVESGSQEMLDKIGKRITLDDVEKYRKGFKTGRGLLIGFGTLTGVGLLTTGIGTVGLMIEGVAVGIGTAFVGPLAALGGADPAIAFDSKFYGVTVAGVCATLTGIAGIVAGTTVLCVYKKRMNTVADVCNSAPSVTLSFGAQKYGTGVALNF